MSWLIIFSYFNSINILIEWVLILQLIFSCWILTLYIRCFPDYSFKPISQKIIEFCSLVSCFDKTFDALSTFFYFSFFNYIFQILNLSCQLINFVIIIHTSPLIFQWLSQHFFCCCFNSFFLRNLLEICG